MKEPNYHLLAFRARHPAPSAILINEKPYTVVKYLRSGKAALISDEGGLPSISTPDKWHMWHTVQIDGTAEFLEVQQSPLSQDDTKRFPWEKLVDLLQALALLINAILQWRR